ncbi:hypothetical protein HMPREF3190_00195 [Umbribacter vaginalis]|nr:hypothetical protein HMPREF3190_00195 [Coriobacteriales bacterium DNF00809]
MCSEKIDSFVLLCIQRMSLFCVLRKKMSDFVRCVNVCYIRTP